MGPKSNVTGVKIQASQAQKLLQDAIAIKAAESSLSFSGDAGAARTPMLYLDPLFDQILVMFPQDNLRELYRRLRHYYKYDPHIRSIIDFHTETPISDFELRCPGHTVAENDYNDFKERKNLFNVCTNALRDYWMLGESFHYGNWDDVNQEYSEFVQLPPEEVEVHSAYVSTQRIYVLRPNREVSKLMRSGNMADRMISEIIKNSNPKQAAAIMRNKPFTLDSNRLIVMQREMSGYSNRGISPLLAVIKDLLYQDFLNLFRTVFIQRHSYPLKIFKIGSEAKGFIPNKRMLNEFRGQLINASNDPDFNIITHPFITVESHTGHDKVLNLVPMYDLVKQRIFAGLFVSEAIVSGEKTPYAAGITFMRGLMNRYLTVRNNLEIELKQKVFAHMARKRGYYYTKAADVSHGVRTGRTDDLLVLPKFFWQKANLLSSQAIQQMLINLRDKGELPFRFISEMFGFDLEDIKYQFEREEGTRVDQLWRKTRDAVVQKDPATQEAYLMGKGVLGVLKERERERMEEADKPDDKKKKPKAPGAGLPPVPDVSPSAPSVTPESPKAPELKSDTLPPTPPPPLPPGTAPLPGDRKPRPGEAEGGGPGGAAGAGA